MSNQEQAAQATPEAPASPEVAAEQLIEQLQHAQAQVQAQALAESLELEPSDMEDDYPPLEPIQISEEELARRMAELGLPPEPTPQLEATQPQAQVVSPLFTELPETTDDMNAEYQQYREYRVRQDERFPNPEPGELVMTRTQLGRTRRPDIRTKPFRIISMGGDINNQVPMWWRSFGLGQAHDKNEAHLFTYDQVVNGVSTYAIDTYIYVKYDDGGAPSEPEAKPEPKPAEAPAKAQPERQRRCDWHQVLGGTLVTMILAHPKNNTIRAKVMAVLKEPIPAEMDTAEKIRDWIEYEFPRMAPAPTQDMVFEVEYTHIETGQATYSRGVHGAYRGAMSRKEITEIARANMDAGWDSIVAEVRNKCVETARTNGQVNYDEPSLTDFQPSGTSGHDAVMITSLRTRVREVLRSTLTLGEINKLGF